MKKAIYIALIASLVLQICACDDNQAPTTGQSTLIPSSILPLETIAPTQMPIVTVSPLESTDPSKELDESISPSEIIGIDNYFSIEHPETEKDFKTYEKVLLQEGNFIFTHVIEEVQNELGGQPETQDYIFRERKDGSERILVFTAPNHCWTFYSYFTYGGWIYLQIHEWAPHSEIYPKGMARINCDSLSFETITPDNSYGLTLYGHMAYYFHHDYVNTESGGLYQIDLKTLETKKLTELPNDYTSYVYGGGNIIDIDYPNIIYEWEDPGDDYCLDVTYIYNIETEETQIRSNRMLLAEDGIVFNDGSEVRYEYSILDWNNDLQEGKEAFNDLLPKFDMEKFITLSLDGKRVLQESNNQYEIYDINGEKAYGCDVDNIMFSPNLNYYILFDMAGDDGTLINIRNNTSCKVQLEYDLTFTFSDDETSFGCIRYDKSNSDNSIYIYDCKDGKLIHKISIDGNEGTTCINQIHSNKKVLYTYKNDSYIIDFDSNNKTLLGHNIFFTKLSEDEKYLAYAKTSVNELLVEMEEPDVDTLDSLDEKGLYIKNMITGDTKFFPYPDTRNEVLRPVKWFSLLKDKQGSGE